MLRPRARWLGALLVLGAASAARGDVQEESAALMARYRSARDVDERRGVVGELSRLGGEPAVVEALGQLLAADPHEAVRIDAARGLVRIGTHEAARVLIDAVDGWDPFVVRAVVEGLGRAAPAATVAWILDEGLDDAEPAREAALITILASLEQTAALRQIERRARSKDEAVRRAVAAALGHLDPEGSERTLVRLARDDGVRVRVAALEALADVPSGKAERALLKALERDDHWTARLQALRSLVRRDPAGARPALLAALERRGEDWRVRLEAVEALRSWRAVEVVAPLIEALGTSDGRLAAAVEDTLRGLTGQPWSGAREWAAWWRQAREGYALPAAAPEAAGEDDPRRTRVRFYGVPVTSRRPCFVLDCSGSMGEPSGTGGATRTPDAPAAAGPTRWEVACEELREALEGLPDDAEFGVLLFNDRVVPVAQTPVAVTKANVAKALAQLQVFGPAGPTDLYGALAAVLHGSAPDDPVAADEVAFDAVYLLSDGLPTAGTVTDPDELRRRVRDFNRFARVEVHVVSIGGEEGRPLLEGLAQDSGGTFTQR